MMHGKKNEIGSFFVRKSGRVRVVPLYSVWVASVTGVSVSVMWSESSPLYKNPRIYYL